MVKIAIYTEYHEYLRINNCSFIDIKHWGIEAYDMKNFQFSSFFPTEHFRYRGRGKFIIDIMFIYF